MPPTNSRAFQRAARQRLTAAEALLTAGFALDARYLGGYAIECSLKALILQSTPVADRPRTLARITTGQRAHDYNVLFEALRRRGIAVPRALGGSRSGVPLGHQFAVRFRTG